MVIGYLYADGVRVAKVGQCEGFLNSWSQRWKATLRGVEFDDGHEPQELYSKVSMLLYITDWEEIGFYEGHFECSMKWFDGFELRMNFRRRKIGKEVKMEMIVSENSSLKEIKEFCEGRKSCEGCPIRGEVSCRVVGRPDKWNLDFRQKFDENALAWMQVMSAGLGEKEVMWLGRDGCAKLYWKIEREDTGSSRIGYLPGELFPCIQAGQSYEVRKVLEESGKYEE